jgi:hypothetical protein
MLFPFGDVLNKTKQGLLIDAVKSFVSYFPFIDIDGGDEFKRDADLDFLHDFEAVASVVIRFAIAFILDGMPQAFKRNLANF